MFARSVADEGRAVAIRADGGRDGTTLRLPFSELPSVGDLQGQAGATRNPPPEAWQKSLSQAVRDVEELLRRLELPAELMPAARQASGEFPLLAPLSYVHRMRRGDPGDPLLLQVLPVASELEETEGFVEDAVGDAAARRAPGLLHKYEGRALLMAARECAVHCRYCFRRHYPYESEPVDLAHWSPALQTISEDESLHEVILSGGDPLLLSNRRLAGLLGRLADIPHLKRVRVHSRLPIVLPDRVDTALLNLLRSTRLQPVMVVHANHPAEVAADCAEALAALVSSGIPTLNQAVLLRGINDDADTLTDLCERLINLGVLPYYLHQLDRVAGAAHFETPIERGRELIQELQRRLPGYAVPRFVREVAGAEGKVPLL